MSPRFAAVCAAPLVFTGCVTPKLAIPADSQRPVVAVGSILNNVKCELKDFQDRYGPYLVDRKINLGGVLTLSVTRSVDHSGGVTVGVPIVAGVTADAGFKSDASSSYGETVVIPFTTVQDGAEAVDCSGVTGRLQTTNGEMGLDGPLLDLTGLGAQLGTIAKGNPKVRLVGIEFKGTLAFVKTNSSSADLTVYVIKPSIGSAKTVQSTLAYDISTDYVDLIKTAMPSTVSSPPPPAAPAPKQQQPVVRVVLTVPRMYAYRPVTGVIGSRRSGGRKQRTASSHAAPVLPTPALPPRITGITNPIRDRLHLSPAQRADLDRLAGPPAGSPPRLPEPDVRTLNDQQ